MVERVRDALLLPLLIVGGASIALAEWRLATLCYALAVVLLLAREARG